MVDVRKIRLILELRELGISDSKTLSALEKIPRETFIPKIFRNQAYENIALPIAEEQTISQPLVVALMVSVALILQIVASRTRFGRRVYAIGGNREAALLAGINVNRITFLTFLIMGALYGLAGLVLASRLNGAPPGGAPFLELDAIAAAVIGGVSLRGGVGLVINALLGALLLAAINNGLSLMNVPTFYQLVVSGLILIIAVFLDSRAKAKT